VQNTFKPELEAYRGMMVNLGWIPVENRYDIQKGSDPLPLLAPPAEGEIPEKDPFTHLINYPTNPNEAEIR